MPDTGVTIPSRLIPALALLTGALLLTGCQSGPPVAAVPKADPASDPGYREDEEKLAAMVAETRKLLGDGKGDAASALVVSGEEVAGRLLAIPKPSLNAMQSASDLDQIYGEMLLSNKRYGWARMLFQKNLARWRYWQPQTDDTMRRLNQARKAIAECDRHIQN